MAEAWDFPVDQWREIPRSKAVESAKATFTREVKQSEDVSSGWHPTVAVPKHDMLREKVGEKIVHGLKEAGFTRARTEKYPFSTFRETVVSGSSSDYDLFVGSWTGGPDPDTFLYPLFHEEMAGRTNGTFFSDPAVMKHLQQARRTRNHGARKRHYEQAVTTLLEQRVHLPAFVLDETFGVKAHVAGFEPHPLSGENPRLTGEPPLRLQ
jgi:peptide/nickel transport system substrate-binding protein